MLILNAKNYHISKKITTTNLDEQQVIKNSATQGLINK